MGTNDALEVINGFYTNDEELLKEKKAKHFDEISKMFYRKNFGMATKAEVELLMFSIFMDEMIEHNQDSDGVLDYKACSDYKLAEMLGIPQSRVRTMKIKKQARYPREFDWRKSFESLKDSIVYDSDKKRIIIPITDPNLYLAIKNFIEENNGYVEIQRGNNFLQMKPEHFFCLLYMGIDSEKEKGKIRKNYIKILKENDEKNSVDNILTDKEMIEKIISIGSDVLKFGGSLVEGVTAPHMLIFNAINTIGKVISK